MGRNKKAQLQGTKQYRVKSGNMDTVIQAFNTDESVKRAIVNNTEKTLGLIIGCLEVGKPEKEERYFSTVAVLKQLGFDVHIRV